MNVDIYLGKTDSNEICGLCGYFDGDNGKNDFISRHGEELEGNGDYKFSESWRLDTFVN